MAERHHVFLRWSRLKQASKPRQDSETAATNGGAVGAPRATAAASDEAFDLASLPSLDSIDGNTDIVAFLRSAVPAELTRAALRRAWRSDPAIRDFIGIAENQWDFNDPNAIPGFGPLVSTQKAEDLLAQVLGRTSQISEALIVPPVDPVRPGPAELILNPPPPPDSTSLNPPRDKLTPRAQLGLAPIEEAREAPQKRRHGSALPR
jgi:hypothetical protein